MDLQKAWKKLEHERLEKPVLGSIQIVKKSKHPVQKLKYAYLASTGFSIAFLIGFIVLFFIFHEPLVKGGIALVILCYIFFFAVNVSMYRKIKSELPVDQSLRSVLLHTYHFVTDNIVFQERVALFIYPIAAASGFLMGASVSGAAIEEFIVKKPVVIALILIMIVLTPSCYWLAHWLHKVSYGKWLAELKERIEEMEKQEQLQLPPESQITP
ncbi:MAG: hypothetical protein ACKOEV_10515 [Cytophagales bacterium]